MRSVSVVLYAYSDLPADALCAAVLDRLTGPPAEDAPEFFDAYVRELSMVRDKAQEVTA